MAPDLQTRTLSIHEFTPAPDSFADFLLNFGIGTVQVVCFNILGAFIAHSLVFISRKFVEAMAKGWYKKQKRFLAQQGKEHFVRIVNSGIYPRWGGMPHVYHTGRSEFWVLKHYGPIIAHFRHWHGEEGLKILAEIHRPWWEALDPYAVHIMVLAQVPDFGVTLRGWILEVNPHPLIAALSPGAIPGRYEPYIHEPP